MHLRLAVDCGHRVDGPYDDHHDALRSDHWSR